MIGKTGEKWIDWSSVFSAFSVHLWDVFKKAGIGTSCKTSILTVRNLAAGLSSKTSDYGVIMKRKMRFKEFPKNLKISIVWSKVIFFFKKIIPRLFWLKPFFTISRVRIFKQNGILMPMKKAAGF